MRIAILTDTHFGARNDSQQFLDYFLDFIENQFLPECEKQNITKILHLGDLMDRRKFVNYNTLNQVRERFFQRLQEKEMTMWCLIGNHDTYYKNTNNINSLRELFSDRFSCFVPIETPCVLDEFDGIKIGMVPWINKENEKECVDFIHSCEADILCGHFELNGYEVMRGVKFENGMDPKILSRFDRVLSGHFHTRHTKNNVHYLGTPYQITFSDLNENKGFYILDTETKELEFIKNNRKMFLSIEYYDKTFETIDNFKDFENKYIKLFVREKKSQTKFDTFIENLYDAKVGSLTVIEDENNIEENIEVADMSLDTLTLIYKEAEDFYSSIEGIDVNKLKRLIQDIYMEALSE